MENAKKYTIRFAAIFVLVAVSFFLPQAKVEAYGQPIQNTSYGGAGSSPNIQANVIQGIGDLSGQGITGLDNIAIKGVSTPTDNGTWGLYRCSNANFTGGCTLVFDSSTGTITRQGSYVQWDFPTHTVVGGAYYYFQFILDNTHTSISLFGCGSGICTTNYFTGAANLSAIYWNVNDVIPVDSTDSRINWIEPIGNTASTTFDITLEYYLNSTYASSTYDSILIQLCPQGYPNAECDKYGFGTDELVLDSLEEETITVTASKVGYTVGLANFWNGEETTECAWYNIFCNEVQSVIGIGKANSFNVATTTIVADFGITQEQALGTCEDSNFAGEAICKTLVYLFYPSESAVNSFVDLANEFDTKIPFAFNNLFAEKIENSEVSSSTWSTYTVTIGDGSGIFDLGTIQIFNWAEAKEKIGAENLETITTWIIYIMWILWGIWILATTSIVLRNL